MASQPSLETRFGFYWRAWRELDTERSIGMAAGPIPLSAIREYARDYGLNLREYEGLKRIMMATDNRYRLLIQEREERRRKES